MVVAEVCSTMKYPKRSQYKHAKQKKYHVRNWAEYNEGLRRRGDLTVWFDEEAIADWKADKTGKPGGQRVYSDMAIETGLVVRMVYKLAYRQTEGFLHSIASLLGLGIEIPDYSTLCRRSRLLRKKLRIPKAASNQPIHLMIDSTGLRIHVGTARKPPKQRAWRKLHIEVDRKTGNNRFSSRVVLDILNWTLRAIFSNHQRHGLGRPPVRLSRRYSSLPREVLDIGSRLHSL